MCHFLTLLAMCLRMHGATRQGLSSTWSKQTHHFSRYWMSTSTLRRSSGRRVFERAYPQAYQQKYGVGIFKSRGVRGLFLRWVYRTRTGLWGLRGFQLGGLMKMSIWVSAVALSILWDYLYLVGRLDGGYHRVGRGEIRDVGEFWKIVGLHSRKYGITYQ